MHFALSFVAGCDEKQGSSPRSERSAGVRAGWHGGVSPPWGISVSRGGVLVASVSSLILDSFDLARQ